MAKEKNESFVDGYLAALLNRAAELVAGDFHKIVLRSGFSVSEWRMMATLEGGKILPLAEVARISLIKPPTLTRMILRLEPKGYVEKVAHDGDQRITLLQSTKRGDRAIAKLVDEARRHEQLFLAPLGADSKELKRLLQKLLSNESVVI